MPAGPFLSPPGVRFVKSLHPLRTACALGVACSVLCGLPGGARGQSLLDRPPNLSGEWVGSSGQLYFNFLHRFIASDAPERKVVNVPTFTLAAGLPFSTLVGLEYSTNSTVAAAYPNEWEFSRAMPSCSRTGGRRLMSACRARTTTPPGEWTARSPWRGARGRCG